MIRARSKRWAASVAIASLMALQAFAGTAGAAVPDALAFSEAIPASYSAGNAAGFRGTYVYKDGSTLSRLFLTVEANGAGAIVYTAATRNGTIVADACGTSLPIICTFRQVRLDDTFVVTTAFTPAAGVTSVTAKYTWSSTGATGSDGGTSHGDTWDGIEHTASLSTDPNYAGGFVTGAGGSIQNVQAVSPTNPQATRLASLPAGVAASVKDGGSVTSPCTTDAEVNCATAFGEWSQANVGDGETFGAPFTISIVYYQGTPKGFVHTYTDPTADDPDELLQEFVGPCPRNDPASGAPCFTWTAKTKTATIYTYHNGSYRGLN